VRMERVVAGSGCGYLSTHKIACSASEWDGHAYQSFSILAPPTIHYVKPIICQLQPALTREWEVAHVAVAPRDDVRPKPIFATHRPPKPHPRRAEKDSLPANRIHVLIFHAA
jgi:hypothetical protein